MRFRFRIVEGDAPVSPALNEIGRLKINARLKAGASQGPMNAAEKAALAGAEVHKHAHRISHLETILAADMEYHRLCAKKGRIGKACGVISRIARHPRSEEGQGD
jgi:hypothetical protein